MDNIKLIWMSAGEASGDQHGAALQAAITRKDPGVRFIGMGGQAMREAGLEPVIRSEDLSVMGLTEVLSHFPKILKFLRTIKRELKTTRPDLVVLLDAPEFNFRVARMAHTLNIPVVYYISPKIWAWRSGRVKFIQRFVREMICILPFERDFYARSGVGVKYVGHPLLDATRSPEILSIHPRQNRIGILPGSRLGELKSLLPLFGESARILKILNPDLKFSLVLAPNVDEVLIRSLWTVDVPLDIHPHQERYSTIRRCHAVMAASGTVTLETGLLETPTVVCYKFAPLTAALAKRVIQVPYASLTNLILQKEVFPELLQERATARNIAAAIWTWRAHPEERIRVIKELERLPSILGSGGAVDRAADIVLDHLRTL
ncbi:MAG: lipid-A-disaccharide synthase [Desulfovibrionales bacterium]